MDGSTYAMHVRSARSWNGVRKLRFSAKLLCETSN